MSIDRVNLKAQELKTRLLLVEDDDNFRRTLAIRLAKREYEVIPAASAEEALNLLQTQDVDVVIADIKLGEMDGIDLLAQIRKKNERLPVILVTGYANLDSARRAVRLEANDYLLKPLENIEQLIASIEKAVQNSKIEKEDRQLQEQLSDAMEAVETTKEKCKDLGKKAKELKRNF